METKNTTKTVSVWNGGLCRKLHRRSGIYHYYIRYQTADGKRRLEKAGTTVSQARKKLALRQGEVAGGSFVDPRAARNQLGPTFHEFADRFLKEYAAQKRSTYYADMLHEAIPAKKIEAAPVRDYFGKRRVKQITEGDLELYATHCKRVDMVGPSTTRKRLTVLGTMFRWGKRAGILTTNPAADLDKPSEPKGKTRFLTAQEWEALHAAAEPWLRPILTVAVHTGFRLKEAAGLRWEDVDLTTGLLTLGDDTKTGEGRSVPMTQTVRTLLEDRGGRFLRDGRVFEEEVFAYGKGKDPVPVRQALNRLSKCAKAVAEAAGLHGVSFHTARHTAGSWMAQAGYSPAQIAKVLGHASTATTQRYMHLAPEHLRGAVDAIEAASKGRPVAPLATQMATQTPPQEMAETPAAGTGTLGAT